MGVRLEGVWQLGTVGQLVGPGLQNVPSEIMKKIGCVLLIRGGPQLLYRKRAKLLQPHYCTDLLRHCS